MDALKALPTVPDARESVGDKVFYREEDGRLTPEALVKPAKLMEDMFVRTVAAGALSIHGSLSRFKALSFSEAQALIDTVARDYGVAMGGKGGTSPSSPTTVVPGPDPGSGTDHGWRDH
ncbi:DUF3164 family protein (plasmid) [Azospirillum argentinense]|uniref:DUF3164 family protein n=1 Tax=Azospirillum argentinense TaxID=2970906 RepID=A0A4D8PUD7_9PROT|nr:DUF3164 family protein [Azospirillum argentinense]